MASGVALVEPIGAAKLEAPSTLSRSRLHDPYPRRLSLVQFLALDDESLHHELLGLVKLLPDAEGQPQERSAIQAVQPLDLVLDGGRTLLDCRLGYPQNAESLPLASVTFPILSCEV